MPLLSAKQQIAIKQESTAGTAISLAAANVVMHTGRAEWTPEVTVVPRESMSASLSPRGSIVASRSAKIKWSQYLRGTSIAPVAVTGEADFAVPFKGCGADVAVTGGVGNEVATYTPSTTIVSDETTGAYCTVSLYEDGKVYKIHGAVGNCVLTFAPGMPIKADFEFTGCYNVPAAGALLAPTYPTVVPPTGISATTQVISGYLTPRLSQFTFDFGNQITMRPAASTTSGYFTAQITGRKPGGTLDPEETTVAVNDWYAQFLAGTTGSMIMLWGATPYNTLILTLPNPIYTGVSLGDRDGVAINSVSYEARANSDAGNDEWSFVQSV
jgi:hypothetical protein